MDAAALLETIEGLGVFLFGGLALYLLLELALLHFQKRKLDLREARMVLLGYGSVALGAALLTRVIGITTVGAAAVVGAALSPFELGLSWPFWIAGWVIYEFWYWVQHWAAHKVRLLWCIHSPHHAPRSIHMMVGTNHHLGESLLLFPIGLGLLPALCGVPPVMCVGLNLIDGIWGSFLHISDEIVPGGRYGWLGRFMQTPAHHRVHHGRNPLYLDRNYNSITLLWDWLLGTLQPLRDDEPVDFGITRKVDTGSFWDVHFGEFRLLWLDVRQAGGLRERLGYLLRPPGWSPDGSTLTATQMKQRLHAHAPAASVRAA